MSEKIIVKKTDMEFGPAQQEELRSLRKKQFERNFDGSVDGPRLRELLDLEEISQKSRPLSAEENAEYLQLTRDQIANTDWTEEKRRRYLELQRIKEGK